MSERVECSSRSEQFESWQTDSSHCPLCGAECFLISELYDENGNYVFDKSEEDKGNDL